VAEHVVEDVGLLEVVELMWLADESPRRKTPVGKVLEEDIVGHQSWISSTSSRSNGSMTRLTQSES